MTQDGKQKSLPMKVDATMLYEQRVVFAGQQRWLGVRRYQRADANLLIDGAKTHSVLRDDRRVVVIAADDDESTLYARQGEFSREELDLLNVPATNLPPEWLLPGEAKQIGDAWKHAPKLLATLLTIDAVSASDVQSVLSEVDEQNAPGPH